MEVKMGEKLQDLILKWCESNGKDAQNNNQSDVASEIDVTYVTWLLKAIGFKLDFMDFVEENGGSNSKSISVEVKCKNSGMTARLSYANGVCICPPKQTNSTFWEIQAPSATGSGPESLNCSSSLLPQLPENCSVVSKAILSNLLNYYKECIQSSSVSSVEEQKDEDKPSSVRRIIKVLDIFDSPDEKKRMEGKKLKMSKSPPEKDQHNTENPHARVTRTGTFPINNPDPSRVAVLPSAESSKPTDTSTENPHIRVTRTGTFPINELDPTRGGVLSSIGLDSSIASLESLNNFGNSFHPFDASPRPSIDERDLNVITALTEARKQIDQALLFMKFNVAQDISPSRGQLFNTPLHRPDQPATPMRRSLTAGSITEHKTSVKKVAHVNRRSSFGIRQAPITPMGSSMLSARRNIGRASIGGSATTTSRLSLSGGASSQSTLSTSSIGGGSTGEFNRSSIARRSAILAANKPSLIERFKMQQAAKKPPPSPAGENKKSATKK